MKGKEKVIKKRWKPTQTNHENCISKNYDKFAHTHIDTDTERETENEFHSKSFRHSFAESRRNFFLSLFLAT